MIPALRARTTSSILPVVVVALAWSALPDEHAAPRTAEQILADIENVDWPGWMSGVSDEEYDRLIQTATDRQIALVDELRRDHPDHPALPKHFLDRWTLMRNVRHANETVIAEANEVLESGPPALHAAALYARAYSAMDAPNLSPHERRELADAALAVEPPDVPGHVDEWKAGILSDLAWNQTADPAEQKRLIARVLKEYRAADSASELVDLYKILKHAGETPDLAGDDVLGGAPVSFASFRGRPTIVVFFSVYNFDRGTSRFRAFEELARVRAHLGDDAPAFVGVLVDETTAQNAESLAENAKKYRIDFPVVRDANHFTEGDDGEKSLAERLRIWNTPCFLRLDDQGRIERVCGRIGPLLAEGA